MAKASTPAVDGEEGDDENLIKICLVNRGEDSETPWAEDLGPAPGPPGSRKVKLVNVPFLHAKPTWGDTIVVSPVEDGLLTWDRAGVPWKDIGKRLVHDGGRWAMIIDYRGAAGDDSGDAAYDAIASACRELDVICEGAWAPEDGELGRAYLAVPTELTTLLVMTALHSVAVGCHLVQVHPAPVAATEPAAKAAAAAKPVAKPAKPAAKHDETPAPAAAKKAAKPGAKPTKPSAPRATATAKPIGKAKPAKSTRPAASARAKSR